MDIHEVVADRAAYLLVGLNKLGEPEASGTTVAAQLTDDELVRPIGRIVSLCDLLERIDRFVIDFGILPIEVLNAETKDQKGENKELLESHTKST